MTKIASVRAYGAVDGDADELPTVTLRDVELISSGGPYFGTGSPPEGDYFDAEFITKLAEETALLVDEYGEWKGVGKIGHSAAQKLLAESGLADDELPALGHMANVRAIETDDGAVKAVADFHRVPRAFGQLVKSGGYRTRSAEIGRVTSQTDGKKHVIITALSWLGAKAPAIRTLDDVVALYADEGIDSGARFGDADLVLALSEADDEPVVEPETDRAFAAWTEEGSLVDLQEKVGSALRALYPEGDGRPWGYVRDVTAEKALLSIHRAGECETYVAAFELADGKATLQPESEWTRVEEQWVEADREMSLATPVGVWTISGGSTGGATSGNANPSGFVVTHTFGATTTTYSAAADTSRHDGNADDMNRDQEEREMRLKNYSDEAVRALAETLGVEAADENLRDAVADKMAADAGAPVVEAAPAAEPVVPAGTVQLSEAEHAELRATAELSRTIAEERRVEKREAVIGRALSEGRIDPAKADQWRSDFDKSPEVVGRLLSEMPVQDEFTRQYGADGDGEASVEAEDELFRKYADATGIRTDA